MISSLRALRSPTRLIQKTWPRQNHPGPRLELIGLRATQCNPPVPATVWESECWKRYSSTRFLWLLAFTAVEASQHGCPRQMRRGCAKTALRKSLLRSFPLILGCARRDESSSRAPDQANRDFFRRKIPDGKKVMTTHEVPHFSRACTLCRAETGSVVLTEDCDWLTKMPESGRRMRFGGSVRIPAARRNSLSPLPHPSVMVAFGGSNGQ